MIKHYRLHGYLFVRKKCVDHSRLNLFMYILVNLLLYFGKEV